MDSVVAESHSTGRFRASAKLRLSAISMIRNESDIIYPFLSHCAELFDSLFVAHVNSTDGTSACLKSFSDQRLRLRVLSVDRQERYQGAIMNLLSREAFADGADWVFCLDGDEFVSVQSRPDLEDFLENLGADVMSMPWKNLVPTKFGTFSSFDVNQNFFWSGRTSAFSKIALSHVFAANNPQYSIQEGNHSVVPALGEEPVYGASGLPLLHVPVRSLDRLKYKIGHGSRSVSAKHNRSPHEGTHLERLDKLLARGAVGAPELRFLAATYGENIARADALDPEFLGWPISQLPSYVAGRQVGEEAVRGSTMFETLLAEAEISWDQTKLAKGSTVVALLDGERIAIIPQVVAGNRTVRPVPFTRLPSSTAPEEYPTNWLADVIATSCTPIRAWEFSA